MRYHSRRRANKKAKGTGWAGTYYKAWEISACIEVGALLDKALYHIG